MAAEKKPATRKKLGTVSLKPKQIEKRLKSVDSLLTVSSVAKHIMENSNEEAKDLLQKAKQKHGLAKKALEAQENEKASKFLGEAEKLVFKAVRASKESVTTQEKKRKHFKRRKKSVEALLMAQKRIFTEKNGSAENRIHDSAIMIFDWAIAMADDDNVDEGISTLREAYTLITTSIREMRGGEIKDRIITFETKKDEYEYEIERNVSLEGLVHQLVREKKLGKSTLKAINGHLDKAGQLRQDAKDIAKNGDYEAGLNTMVESTRAVVYALRRAGIYIPEP